MIRARQMADGTWTALHPIRGTVGHGGTIEEAKSDMAYRFWRARAMDLHQQNHDASYEIEQLEREVRKRKIESRVQMAISSALCLTLAYMLAA